MKLPEDTTGCLNGWHCPECNRVSLAVHADHGVTPMFLACRYDDCEGMASSLMYPWERMGMFRRNQDDHIPVRVVEQVAWEWYLPTEAELEHTTREVRDHVERGGLLIRPLSDRGRQLLAERKGPT